MKKLIALCLTGSLALSLAACGGTDTSEGAVSMDGAESEKVSSVPEAAPEPAPNLTGTWTQVGAGESYQQATISGETIVINWIGEDGSASLYWAGTFTAPETAEEPYTWTSANDTAQTGGALLASSDESKDFAYQDGKISYEVSAMGVTTTVELEKTSDDAELPEGTTEATAGGGTFADGVLTTGGYTITITDYKVIQPGETGNEYGEKPVIAFWYDTTNTGSASEINASTAWIMVFEAVQDNDPNAVNTLNMGLLPDQQFLDSQVESIKDGGTVSNAVAYELDDTTTPVTLVASDMLGNEYGRQNFSLSEVETQSMSSENSDMTSAEFASAIEKSLNQGVTAGSSATANGENITITYCSEGTSLLTVDAKYWENVKETSMMYYQTVIDAAETMGVECSIIMNVVDSSNVDVPLLTIENGSFTYDVVA